jgi:hypothetical protein
MRVREVIENGLQELVNTKHLYQSVTLNFEPCIREQAAKQIAWRTAAAVPGTPRIPIPLQSDEEIVESLLEGLDAKDWSYGSVLFKEFDGFFTLPPIRLLCSVCGAVEPFNLWDEESQRQAISLGKPGQQVFWFPVQCQRCKDSVVVLLIRRIGRKIKLVGRSEFEVVKAPSYIPKAQATFYSRAVVAFNSGEGLAGLFLLRTLIEQHMRAVTGSDELRGDSLCDEYSNTLPEKLKGIIPSLKTAYGKISDALHRAISPEGLFESQQEQIELHFENLSLFARTNK